MRRRALHYYHKRGTCKGLRKGLHGLARRALRSGAIAHDPPVTAAGAAAILAAAGSTEPAAPGLPGLPLCAATARLCRDAVGGWTPARHWLHHSCFRDAVRTLLHVHERGWRLQGLEPEPEGDAEVEAATVDVLPYLPVELWFLLCAHLQRHDFPSRSLPT